MTDPSSRNPAPLRPPWSRSVEGCGSETWRGPGGRTPVIVGLLAEARGLLRGNDARGEERGVLDRTGPVTTMEIYAESFRGEEHLARIVAEAQAIVDTTLAVD